MFRQAMNRLTELMQAAGLNKTQVAAQLGVGEVTVRRWQRGDTGIPDRQKLALADLFGVSVTWLMGWEDLPNGDGNDGERVAA